MNEHYLKNIPELFVQTLKGQKLFEYRRDDRDFYPGDKLLLWEYEKNGNFKYGNYSGRVIECLVLEVWGAGWTEIPGLPDDFVIMNIKVLNYWGNLKPNRERLDGVSHSEINIPADQDDSLILDDDFDNLDDL